MSVYRREGEDARSFIRRRIDMHKYHPHPDPDAGTCGRAAATVSNCVLISVFNFAEANGASVGIGNDTETFMQVT